MPNFGDIAANQAITGAGAPAIAAPDGTVYTNTTANAHYFRSSGAWQGPLPALGAGTPAVWARNQVGAAGVSTAGARLDHVHDTTRVQANQTSTGAIAGAGSADVTVTWTTAFPSGLYTPVTSIVENSAGNNLEVLKIVSIIAASMVVRVINNDAVNTRTGTLLSIGIL